MVLSATQLLCEHLGNAAELLEQGDAVAAAEEMEAMKELYPRLPTSMPSGEYEIAKQLFQRCANAETVLRRQVSEALARLGAGRRAEVYR
jgi:hypothetical protein